MGQSWRLLSVIRRRPGVRLRKRHRRLRQHFGKSQKGYQEEEHGYPEKWNGRATTLTHNFAKAYTESYARVFQLLSMLAKQLYESKVIAKAARGSQ